MGKAKKITIIAVVALAAVAAIVLGIVFKLQKGNEYNDGKRHLNIGNYDGAFGGAWLDYAIEKFEEKYNDTVEVHVTPEKDLFTSTTLLTNMKTNGLDLYLLNNLEYDAHVAAGTLLDITETVTAPLAEYGESESIDDKMLDMVKSYYKRADNKYYAVPFHMAFTSVVYDIDLFEERGFYFGEDGELILERKNVEKRAGADGVKGTSDDGLPVTFDEFFILLDEMVGQGVTPFTWTGQYPLYRQRWLASIWADYEGAYNWQLNNTFDGDYTFPAGTFTSAEAGQYGVTVNADGTQNVKITNRNAYLLQKQPGKKYALEFAYKLMSDTRYFTNSSFLPSQSHLIAQGEYLQSRKNNKPIAMMVDNTWWEIEAKGVFDEMSISGSQWSRENRRFGVMPIPKTEGSAEGETYLCTGGDSVICIYKGAKEPELAKEFLRFLHSDEMLRYFNTYNYVMRPYDYTLTEEDRAQMTEFSLDIYDKVRANLDDVVFYSLYPSELKRANTSTFSQWAWTTTVNGAAYNEPFRDFLNVKTLTVDKWITGMFQTYQPTWETKYSKWF